MKENTGKKEKRGVRFNLLDALILLAILLLIAGVFLRGRLAGRVASESRSKSVDIVFYVNDVKKETGEAALTGEKVFWKQNSMLIGQIEEVTSSPAEIYTECADGTTALSYDENRCDLRITVRAQGTETPEGFMLNGSQFIAAGKEMILLTPTIEVESLVASVRAVG